MVTVMPYERYVHYRHSRLAGVVEQARTDVAALRSHSGTVIIERPAL